MKTLLIVIASMMLLVGCGAIEDERNQLRTKCENEGGKFTDFSDSYGVKYFCTIDGQVYKLTK